MDISHANLILENFMWRLPLHRLPNTHTQICHTWLTEQALKAVGCAFCWLSIRDGHADADYADWCAYVHMRMRCGRQNLIAHSRPKNRSNIGQKWAKIGQKSVKNQSKMCKNWPKMEIFILLLIRIMRICGLCGCGLCASQKSGAWPSLLSIDLDYWLSSYFYWISIDCLVFC